MYVYVCTCMCAYYVYQDTCTEKVIGEQFLIEENLKQLWSESCSVMSNSLWPHGLYSPWNSPGQNTGVSSISLSQGIFPTQGLNLLATEWNTNTAEWFESLYFNTCFLQLLYFISLAQQPTGQVAKHYDSETIQCAGAGWDNLYLDLFTAAKTLFWGTSLST